MRTSYLILSLIFMVFYSQVESQESNVLSKNDEIKVLVYTKLENNVEDWLASEFTFNDQGEILRINSERLKPWFVESMDAKFSVEYFYDEIGRIKEEKLFEIAEEKIELIRVTKFAYVKDCIEVKVTAVKLDELIGDIEECRNKDGLFKTQEFKLDKVFFKESGILKGAEIEWQFNEDLSLKRIQISSEGANAFLIVKNFIHKGNYSIVFNKWNTRDTTFTFEEYQFYDKYNRLKALGSSINRNKWMIKIGYSKLGFVNKFIHRGNMHLTNEKVKLFKYAKVDVPLHLLNQYKKDKTIINKINDDLLKMFYSGTGGGIPYDYLDARRFINN